MCENTSSTSAQTEEEGSSSNQSVNSNTNRGRALILYRAWQICSGISILLLFSTAGALLSAQDHGTLVRQYTSTFVMLSVSMVLAAVFLIFGCIEYHTPWTNGILEKQESTSKVRPCDFEKFRDGYNKMRSARAGIYIEVILSFFLYLLPQYITRISYFSTYSVIYDWFFVLSVLANGFALAQCSFQTSWIGTSRRTPSIGIAVANVILYFAVILDLVCNGTNQILLHPFLDITGASLRENINNIFNSIPDGVKTGVIVATGVALLKDFISQMLASINNQHPANLTQQRRHIRHRLLTHWNYTGRVSTFSRENFRTEFLTTNVLIGAFFVLIVISHNAWDTVPSPDTPEDGIVSVAIYSLIFMLFSFASLWSIRDETLIQSEHMYLSVKSIKLYKDSIRRNGDGPPTSAWMDFCQVLCNLTANVSGIDSEDADYQNIAPMISATAQMITLTEGKNCEPDECKRALFFCDILRAKGNIQALILRDASHEKNENDTIFYSSNAPLQIARDLRFANLMAELIGDDSLYPTVPKPDESSSTETDNGKRYTSTPLCFVKSMLELFFKNNTLDFVSISDMYGISNYDIINLLKIDILQYLFHYEAQQNNCGLSWLGCCYADPCAMNAKKQAVAGTSQKAEEKYEREIFALTLPFLIIDRFHSRWRNADVSTINSLFLESIYNYYKSLQLGLQNVDKEMIALMSFQRLLSSEFNLSIILTINAVIDGYLILKTRALSTTENHSQKKITAEAEGTTNKDQQSETNMDKGIMFNMLNKRFSALAFDCWIKKGLAQQTEMKDIYTYWKSVIDIASKEQAGK